ncbi:uncharacterized protein LOC119107314 [Pollicipes pollicipes]|uniref:uncharacterized protein LOC119107314 n=1 Tax=Pollicipes pollicipes TaxID=41117 RepID=UPI0018855154|nr:uncharacterized protein LOC119107314 [Pollicipes pollicipes]
MSVCVNCWFCSEDSQVPAYSRDSWECPKCDQYNGFTPEGDVALPVTASTDRQHVRYNVQVRQRVDPTWQLCHRCNLNQALKTRQLANFRPIVEDNWEAELEEYAAHLERLYDTCTYCKAVVARALREKDELVRPSWLAWLRQQAQEQVGRLEPTAEASAGTRPRRQVVSAVHSSLVMLYGAGLTLLWLLLLSSCLQRLSRSVLPAEYYAVLSSVSCACAENKAVFALSCFVFWVLVRGAYVKVQNLLTVLLWAGFCVVEMASGGYMDSSAAATLQTVLVSGLLFVRSRRLHPRGVQTVHMKPQTANGTANGVSPFRTPVTTSTPKLSPSGAALASPKLANGHATFAARPTPQDDYNLPQLSLGSPRKGAGSPGVFALRTYQPPASALFTPRRVLSPPRLRSELHHSSWIAGGYWQRGGGGGALAAGTPLANPLSRSSSQSSGFVDAYGSGGGSALSEERAGRLSPASTSAWGGDESAAAARAELAHETHSCVGSHSRSFVSTQTPDGSLLGAAASHKSVLVALVLGFSVAFNVFAVMVLLFKDRL